MKIEDTQEVGFKPFSITIESLDEARMLWWLLYMDAEVVENSWRKSEEDCERPTQFWNSDQFNALNDYMIAKGYK